MASITLVLKDQLDVCPGPNSSQTAAFLEVDLSLNEVLLHIISLTSWEGRQRPHKPPPVARQPTPMSLPVVSPLLSLPPLSPHRMKEPPHWW